MALRKFIYLTRMVIIPQNPEHASMKGMRREKKKGSGRRRDKPQRGDIL